jgi:uncharacterized membrane protein HdeD (DUF308 family)
MLHDLTRNWWMLILRGLAGIVFGLGAYAWPGLTLGLLVVLFGAYALIDGILAVISALAGRTQGLPWWTLLVEGMLGVAAGVFTFLWPGVTLVVLLYVMAAWAIVTGIFEIAAAIRLRKAVEGEWTLALSGVVSVVFGLILFTRPFAGLLAVAWLIGTYAVIFGLLLLFLGLKLRERSRATP